MHFIPVQIQINSIPPPSLHFLGSWFFHFPEFLPRGSSELIFLKFNGIGAVPLLFPLLDSKAHRRLRSVFTAVVRRRRRQSSWSSSEFFNFTFCPFRRRRRKLSMILNGNSGTPMAQRKISLNCFAVLCSSRGSDLFAQLR